MLQRRAARIFQARGLPKRWFSITFEGAPTGSSTASEIPKLTYFDPTIAAGAAQGEDSSGSHGSDAFHADSSTTHEGGRIIVDYAKYKSSLPGPGERPVWGGNDNVYQDRTCGAHGVDDDVKAASNGQLEDIVKLTAQQIAGILWKTRNRISPWRAFKMYEELPANKRFIGSLEQFEPLYRWVNAIYRNKIRMDRKRGQAKKKARGAENPGYEEPEYDPPIENPRSAKLIIITILLVSFYKRRSFVTLRCKIYVQYTARQRCTNNTINAPHCHPFLWRFL